MTTAIIGVGNLGGTVARHLVGGGESVVLAAADQEHATAQRLIRAAGFEPLKVEGVSDAGRIEGPDGDLQGRTLALDEALATTATEGVKA